MSEMMIFINKIYTADLVTSVRYEVVFFGDFPDL